MHIGIWSNTIKRRICWRIRNHNLKSPLFLKEEFLSGGGGSKITADGDCSHEIKKHLFLGKKAMTNLDSILKSRDLCQQRSSSQGYSFSSSHVWMWELDYKKAEGWRINAFELWCWRRLLRVPWTARRSNQYILKEINSEYSFEGLMLKLKLQHFGYLMQSSDTLEKTLMLGKIEGRRRRGQQDEMAST